VTALQPAMRIGVQLAVALGLIMALAAAGTAQIADGAALPNVVVPRSVDGRVVIPKPSGLRPVPSAWVVLHRVGHDAAGAIDSTRSDQRGRFAFHFTPRAGDDASFYLSASYGGIAYFSAPLEGAHVTGDAAEITVYDTTSKAIPLRVRGRHVIVASAAASGERKVLEVFELSNDTSVTRVSSTGGDATWSTPAPAGARDFRVAPGSVGEAAITMRNGQVNVYVPFAPGLKQVAYSYSLPPAAFPWSVPMDGAPSVLEVLLEETASTARGARLAEMKSVDVEGRHFRRYLAQDVPASAVAVIAVPVAAIATGRGAIAPIVIAIAAVMLTTLAVTLARHRATPVRVLANGDRAG
jgi:hypothetical protein